MFGDPSVACPFRTGLADAWVEPDISEQVSGGWEPWMSPIAGISVAAVVALTPVSRNGRSCRTEPRGARREDPYPVGRHDRDRSRHQPWHSVGFTTTLVPGDPPREP